MGQDEYYAEQSADEIFSGPTHELLPSSYSSFHHHHHLASQSDVEEDGRSQHLFHPGHDYGQHVERRSSMWSNRSRRPSEGSEYDDGEESLSRFHFFSRDEISHAEGGTTVVGDEDSVEEALSDSESVMSTTGLLDSTGVSTTSEHAPAHTYLGGGDDHSTSSGMSGTRSELFTESRPHRFEYHSERKQQRYYIAEEDMRIVCAGYSLVHIRLWLYYLLCVASFGLLYLVFRWFPRQRLRLVAKETPLGKCDFVVIENQWGELEFVEVTVQRYNHALSSVFNLRNMELEDENETLAPTADDSRRTDGDSVVSYIDGDPNVPYLRVLEYRYIRFLYNPVKDMFFTNTDWVSSSWSTVESATEGLDGDSQYRSEQVFGKNSLTIKQASVTKLLVDEVLNPFYMFQVFSIALWLFDDYYYYAAAILIISVLSVAEALNETKKGMARLAAIAEANSDAEITVLRSGFWLTIQVEDLVPGDVYELSDPTLSMLPVDSVLLSGDCIVNESILTGESVPVAKVPATDKSLSALVAEGTHSPQTARSFLYGGTKIIRVRKPPADHDDFKPALALVIRTGFTTTKGALVRSMMFPRPSGFKFYRDSFRYIGVMAVVALLGFSISAIRFVQIGLDTSLIILRALDIVTVVVPPALPATLTIGTNFSLARLRSKDIYCITPSRINVAGRVNIVAFDKTGTLTEEGLDVLGAHVVHEESGHRKFKSLAMSADELAKGKDHSLLDTLVACHELRNIDGELMGDPLDVKMFEFTGWSLDEEHKRLVSPDNTRELKVYKRFEFASQLRRMSVIASSGTSSSGTRVLAKGAPEIMRQICTPESLPVNFDEVLHQSTHRGFRVIACAWRDVGDISDYDRSELESGLTFAGLIIFENKLKPTSRGVIEDLQQARIRTLMCTGDNVLTAVSVGRECGIIPHGVTVFAGHFDDKDELRWEGVDSPELKLDRDTLKPMTAVGGEYVLAITGDVFSHIVEYGTYDALDQMLLRGVIFARMSPDEKHELVIKLQRIDYTACFCGDGANDCGALKEADVGISLSEAEASVAAPFTSKKFDITCVPQVLAEGRCALVTSFSCFKYMSMYSAIQFITVTILYGFGSNIGDFQFLWIDLFLIVPIAAFMAWSGPADTLSKKRPGAELVSRKVLVPLLSYMVIFCFFQVAAWWSGLFEPWYVAPIAGDNDNLRSTDNTSLFYVSSFQYIMAGYILSEGAPFRVPTAQNTPFMATIFVTMTVTLFFMALPEKSGLARLMDLTYESIPFKLGLLCLVAANFGTLLLAKAYLFGPLSTLIKAIKRNLGVHKVRPRYKEIIEENGLSA